MRPLLMKSFDRRQRDENAPAVTEALELAALDAITHRLGAYPQDYSCFGDGHVGAIRECGVGRRGDLRNTSTVFGAFLAH